MRVTILGMLLLALTACQHAPVRCDRHLVPINPVTTVHASSASKASVGHP